MRKIIYSVLYVTAAVFCIFLAAVAVCGCSGMDGAAGNMTGKEEKRLNEEMAEKMERRLPEEVKRLAKIRPLRRWIGFLPSFM